MAQTTKSSSSALGWIAAVMGVIALGQCVSQAPSERSAPTSDQKFVQAWSLNCRAAPSQHADIVRALERNEAVQIVEERGGWERVDGSTDCWVSSQYLASFAASEPEVSQPPGRASGLLTDFRAPSQETYAPAPRPEHVRSYGGGAFANCAAARAAGAAPVRETDRGYSRRLDRDGDGIGCE